jgi:hypothetical protein
MDLGASPEPAPVRDQLAGYDQQIGRDQQAGRDQQIGNDAGPQRVEAAGTAMAEHTAGTPRQQAVASPAAQSPTLSAGGPLNAPPRTVRGQSSGLFTPAQPIAATSRPSAPRAVSPEPSRSLFGLVTGVFGRRHAVGPDVQAPPPVAPVHEPAGEQMRPTVRQTTAEDIGIGIPNFLLRQTSGAVAPSRR